MSDTHDFGIAVVVNLHQTGPKSATIGKLQARSISTVARRLTGQVSDAPSEVSDHAVWRTSSAVKLLPVGHDPSSDILSIIAAEQHAG